MGIGSYVAIFLVVWWTVLFAVLPLGNKTYAELGMEITDGGDPGAPYKPNLKRKFFTTTWVALVVVGIIWAIIRFRLIDLSMLPGGV